MLTVRATLLRDTFEGGQHDNPRAPEWPPSWMRLFSALVSVAEDGGDDELLTLLENSEPPNIHASRHLPSVRSAFVPTNATQETTHTVLVGRTNSERGWARAVPQSRSVWYRWLDLDLTSEQRRAFDSLCRRVPYLGRSTSPAIIAVVDEEPEETELVPSTRLERHEELAHGTTIRCPYPGALSALRSAHEARIHRGEPGHPWEVGIGVEYGVAQVRTESVTAGSPYQTLVVFRLEGRKLDGRHTARVTYHFRRAILARSDEHIAVLHGHHDGDVVQCAFLGLPFVDASYSDGRLLGVGIALPTLSESDARVVGSALPPSGEQLRVKAGPLGTLSFRRLSPLDASGEPWGLAPRRWMEKSSTWSTAVPLVLDRYPGRGGDLVEEVRRAVVNARLPEPEAVWESQTPYLRGGIRMTPRDTLRRPSDKTFRPYRHATIRFPEPVEGVVVIGSMRHYGLGLCAPLHNEVEDD